MNKIICLHCKKENSLKAKYCIECGFELSKPEISKPVAETLPVKEKKKKNKFLLPVLLFSCAIVLAATGYVAYKAVQKIADSPLPKIVKSLSSLEGQMELVAETTNKNCPAMIDTETQLDNLEVLPEKVFQYNYTLIHYDRSQIDTLQVKNTISQNIVSSLKGNPQLKFQRDNNITLKYQYKDKNGAYIMSIIVTPEMYK